MWRTTYNVEGNNVQEADASVQSSLTCTSACCSTTVKAATTVHPAILSSRVHLNTIQYTATLTLTLTQALALWLTPALPSALDRWYVTLRPNASPPPPSGRQTRLAPAATG
jgi:hypothetical protein